MTIEKAKLSYLDIMELVLHICELPEDAEDDQIDQALYDKFEMDQDQLHKLAEVLVPLCVAGTSPLTGKHFRGFGFNGIWIAKQETAPATTTRTTVE